MSSRLLDLELGQRAPENKNFLENKDGTAGGLFLLYRPSFLDCQFYFDDQRTGVFVFLTAGYKKLLIYI